MSAKPKNHPKPDLVDPFELPPDPASEPAPGLGEPRVFVDGDTVVVEVDPGARVEVRPRGGKPRDGGRLDAPR